MFNTIQLFEGEIYSRAQTRICPFPLKRFIYFFFLVSILACKGCKVCWGKEEAGRKDYITPIKVCVCCLCGYFSTQHKQQPPPPLQFDNSATLLPVNGFIAAAGLLLTPSSSSSSSSFIISICIYRIGFLPKVKKGGGLWLKRNSI